MHTLKQLVNQNGAIFLHIASERLCRLFLAQAEAEGFHRPRELQAVAPCILRLGRNCIHAVEDHILRAYKISDFLGERPISRIDYRKYVCEERDYLLPRPVLEPAEEMILRREEREKQAEFRSLLLQARQAYWSAAPDKPASCGREAVTDRSLDRLLDRNQSLYILLRSGADHRLFLSQAQAEGFSFPKNICANAGCLYALCQDRSFSHVGFAGYMAYRSADESSFRPICRIDYRKYVCGADDYMISRAAVQAEEEAKRLQSRQREQQAKYDWFTALLKQEQLLFSEETNQ